MKSFVLLFGLLPTLLFSQSQFGVRGTMLLGYTDQQSYTTENTYFGSNLATFQFDFLRKTTFANAANLPNTAAYFGLRTLFDFETINLDYVDCGNSDYPILVGKQEFRLGLVGGVEQYIHFKKSAQKRFQLVLGAEGQFNYALLDNRDFENPISGEESSNALSTNRRFQLGAEASLGVRYQIQKSNPQKHVMFSLPFQFIYTPGIPSEVYHVSSWFVVPGLRVAFFW